MNSGEPLKSHERQKIEEGYGAMYHRTYSITFPGDKKTAQRAMQDLQRDLNAFSPQLLATFEKVTGQTKLQPGDEYFIHIAGPWDGPVRVGKVDDKEFKLITLRGHLEAGEIVFRIHPSDKGEQKFEIESLARSRDFIVDFVYDKVPVAKAAQTEMWSTFLKNVATHAAELAGAPAEKIGEVQITTERRDEDSQQWQQI